MPFNSLLPFDTRVEVRTRGYLPHWQIDHAVYFVTFRLVDSLPREVIDRLRHERQALERQITRGERELTALENVHIRKFIERQTDAVLDRGLGACHLAKPAAAQVVIDALRHFEGTRYRQIAWCVMPNHVHTVFVLLDDLKRVVHSWKSFTANRINEITGATGPLWQREYYDRVIRSEEELEETARYVVENPVKAGMTDWPYVWLAG